MKRILFAVIVMAVSCSSPQGDGKKAAQAEKRAAENYIESVQKLESNFVNHFNPKDYSLRSEAIEAYKEERERIGDNYKKSLDQTSIRKSKLKGKYANNYKALNRFEEAYDSAVDNDLAVSAMALFISEDIPDAVVASINSIIPPKPDEERIKADLVGHTLNEGFAKEDCYHNEDWRWRIAEGEIKEFHIDEVLEDDANEYTFNASMVLKAEYLGYDTSAQIYYVLPDGKDWQLDLVKSLGMRVIKTGKYDDCIRCALDDDAWGGIDALYITNTSEVQLEVFGQKVANNQKSKFVVQIPPGKKAQVGGVFFGGHVTDYHIDAVERDQ